MAPDGYSIETIDLPDTEAMEIGGVEAREDGAVLASTRSGELWEYDPDVDGWSNLTRSLHTALGVWVDDETDDVFTAQMPRLSRLVDETDDGTIDRFETISQEWGFSGNYHEFAYGPVRDSKGNFYVTLNLSHGAGGSVKGSTMGRGAPYRGWAVKITPDGEFVPYASGLRSPSGLGITGDDEVFFTDNQGDYMPTNHLSHLREGEYYGHPAGLQEHPDFEDENLNDVSDEAYDDLRTNHAVWVPYAESNATTGVAFEVSGAFGPFEGQVFLGEQTQSKVLRASLEEVDGHYQGAVFNFADGFQSGVIDVAFSPDGESLWVGQADRGWGAVGGDPYGFQRLGYDGETIPFEMRSVSIRSSGFEIEFTEPVDEDAAADPGNYDVSHWTYDNDSSYGSNRLDLVALETDEIDVSVEAGGERVVLQLPEIYVTPEDEEGLVGGTRVYELALSGIESAEGDPLENDQAWYTVNYLPAGVGLTAETEQLDEETVSVTGHLDAPRKSLTDGELTLTAGTDSLELAAETETTFDELAVDEAFEAEWTVSVPETGEYDLELGASYVENGEAMTKSTPVSVTVFPFPESVVPNEIGVGADPSSDATILWDGEEHTLDDWEGTDGGEAEWIEHEDHFEVDYGTGDIRSLKEFGDCHLHLEWRAPEDAEGSGQSRTNSGVFLMDRYEFQVLDNYENPTYGDGWAGSYYAQAPPLVSPLRPPGEWQSYDIIWRRPQFNENGELERPAQATVLLNGVVVLAHLDIEGPNPAGSIGEYEPHPPEGPIRLQDHNDITPPHYRNVWYRPLPEAEFERDAFDHLLLDYDFELYETTAGTDDVGTITPGGSGTSGEPPSDAELLLEDGLEGWESSGGGEPGWNETDEYVEAVPGAGDVQTEEAIGDAQIHLEWRIPEDVEGEGTDRGNSGTLLMGRYQLQLLDSHGNPVDPAQWAGAYPDQTPPQVSPIKPPGEWQTLDVFWQGPRFDGVELARPARVTALLNETVVQARLVPRGQNPDEAVEEYEPHPPEEPLRLQENGSPVQFRNAWYRDLDPDAESNAPDKVAYYSLDDDTATNEVTGQDAEITGDPTPGVEGVINDAWEFTNSGDQSDHENALTSQEDLALNGSGATVAAWVNWTDRDRYARFYQVGGSLTQNPAGVGAGYETAIEGEPDEPDNLWVYTDQGESLSTDIIVDPNEWHFVVTVVDGDTIRAHVFDEDGELDNSPQSASVGRTQSAAEPLYMMCGDNAEIAGRIDEVYAFSRALTESEVETLWETNSLEGGELLSVPYAMDCGGAHTDETVTIDGLEFHPSAEVAQSIEMNLANRPLTQDEIWWPDSVVADPNPNSNADSFNDEWDPLPEIDGTDHDSLYQTEHWANGELRYTFHVENGTYDVTLHFAEIVQTSAGGRVFSASVNGEPVVEDLDLYADHGPTTAATYTAEGVEVDDDELVVELESSVENPKISGIEIRETPIDLLSAPYAMDCGGAHTDETVTIDGLEFDPSPEVSKEINMNCQNRELNSEEIWWPEQVEIEPNPNSYSDGCSFPEIDGTDHDSLYQTEHWAEEELSYTFHVENGTYDVTLHFAEINDEPGMPRIFDVLVQGEAVIEDLRPIEEAGSNVAIVEIIEGVEVTDEMLTIAGVSSSENPKFSAIEIREADAS